MTDGGDRFLMKRSELPEEMERAPVYCTSEIIISTVWRSYLPLVFCYKIRSLFSSSRWLLPKQVPYYLVWDQLVRPTCSRNEACSRVGGGGGGGGVFRRNWCVVSAVPDQMMRAIPSLFWKD